MTVCVKSIDQIGTLRDEDAVLWFFTLEKSMKNAHHDQPGYWDHM